MYEIKDIIIVLLVLAVFYLIYKTRNLEKFTVSDDIKETINDIYKADINAIRNLSNFATSIYNEGDSFTIPANKVTIPGYFDIVQLKGAIIAWSLPTIPKGWAICDGQKYKLDSNYNAVLDSNGMQTPDLRGRFILGSGVGAKDMNNNELTERLINNTGGEENHKLTINEMPSHTHTHIDRMLPTPNDDTATQAPIFTNIGLTVVDKAPPNGWGAGLWQAWASSKDKPIYGKNDITGSIGNDKSHNIMPPFYVLTYIMKL
jgi:microcystin-dependent protein